MTMSHMIFRIKVFYIYLNNIETKLVKYRETLVISITS